MRSSKKLSVRIPPGVDSGDRFRLAGEGEAGERGGPAGDFYVEVDVREHPVFAREGRHLHCEAPISFVEAALGGSIEVAGLTGPVKFEVPPETQTGTTLRLRGKGVRPARGGPPGDLLCKVVVQTPTQITDRQKRLLHKLKRSMRH